MAEIHQVFTDKSNYMDILLIGDEQEDMVLKYLDRSELFVLENCGKTIGVCAVTDEGGGVCELKNISVKPGFQRQGYGKKMVDFVISNYSGRFREIKVGTGDSPLTVPFYEKCGFVRSHIVKNFFTDNYDHPIYECGIQLKDMIYFRRSLCENETK